MRADSLHHPKRMDRLADLLVNAAKHYRAGTSFTVLDLYAVDRRICEYSKGEVGGMCRRVFVKDPRYVLAKGERTRWMLKSS